MPEEFHRLEHPPQLPLRVQPQFHENVNELWYIPDQDVADAAIIKDVSNIMNPGQSTVITFDQQLYCKAKEL